MVILSCSTYANTQSMSFTETLLLLLSEPRDVWHLARTSKAQSTRRVGKQLIACWDRVWIVALIVIQAHILSFKSSFAWLFWTLSYVLALCCLITLNCADRHPGNTKCFCSNHLIHHFSSINSPSFLNSDSDIYIVINESLSKDRFLHNKCLQSIYIVVLTFQQAVSAKQSN